MASTSAPEETSAAKPPGDYGRAPQDPLAGMSTPLEAPQSDPTPHEAGVATYAMNGREATPIRIADAHSVILVSPHDAQTSSMPQFQIEIQLLDEHAEVEASDASAKERPACVYVPLRSSHATRVRAPHALRRERTHLSRASSSMPHAAPALLDRAAAARRVSDFVDMPYEQKYEQLHEALAAKSMRDRKSRGRTWHCAPDEILVARPAIESFEFVRRESAQGFECLSEEKVLIESEPLGPEHIGTPALALPEREKPFELDEGIADAQGYLSNSIPAFERFHSHAELSLSVSEQ
jgi:hypothetical protein